MLKARFCKILGIYFENLTSDAIHGNASDM